MKNKSRNLSVKKMTITGVLGAISIVLGLTPLGFIPIGPTKATIMHIPVIIGSIMEGPIVGGLIGLIFGIFSIIQAITNPTPVSIVFYNPLIAIMPRVLMGVVTYYVYEFFSKNESRLVRWILNLALGGAIVYLGNLVRLSIVQDAGIFQIGLNIILIGLLALMMYNINSKEKDIVDIIIASTVGTLINTVGVLSGIYFFHGARYAQALGQSPEFAGKLIAGIAVTNGIPEIIIGVIITVSVIKSLKNNK